MICVAPDVGGTERARALGKILNVGLILLIKEDLNLLNHK